MEFSEIRDIAESLKRRLELMKEAGITSIPRTAGKGAPAQGACPADWALFTGHLSEAASFAPCGHSEWKGVLFGVWRLGGAAITWGVPATGESLHDTPFGEEALSQLEKMLGWLSGEIKADMPDISNPQAAISAKCPASGTYSDAEAAKTAAPAVSALAQGARAMLIMGPLAAWALLQSADLKASRGKALSGEGLTAVATWGPDDLLRDQGRKKEAHADLKLLIGALGD